MKKIIGGIILGTIIGFWLSSFKRVSNSSNGVDTLSKVEDVQAEENNAELESQKKSMQEEIQPHGSEEPVVAFEAEKQIVERNSPEIEENEKSEKSHIHVLNLDISEDQVVQMEQHLIDLQKDVSLFRDKTGWIVRFHVQDNLLANTGIRDNDLIRFGHIEKLKEDPNRADLITRLEAVMMSLQR